MQTHFDHCAALVREADRDRYLATLFAPAEPCDDLTAGGVASEMESAEALDRQDLALAQERHGGHHRIGSSDCRARGIDQAQARAARGARVRLGVKAP